MGIPWLRGGRIRLADRPADPVPCQRNREPDRKAKHKVRNVWIEEWKHENPLLSNLCLVKIRSYFSESVRKGQEKMTPHPEDGCGVNTS